MATSGFGNKGEAQRVAATTGGPDQLPVERYLQLLLHRKWVVLGVWLLVSVATVIYALRLPDVFSSDTLILVDPQKVPEAYVKSTVTGDIRNRLSTLSQQILSQSRLQKIIETLNLYPAERKKLAREDVISLMRSDISVKVISDFGATQDLQAFRISYNGAEPRLVAQVTNQIATLFIDENLKAREQLATGTTDFLTNQLHEARTTLQTQEAKLRDFRLKHVGEMPKQEAADLQLLAQAQLQWQMASDALGRAEQQKSSIQSMMVQDSPPVVEIDDGEQQGPSAPATKVTRALKPSANDMARLAVLLTRYSENHPDVKKLKKQIEMEEAKEAKEAAKEAATVAATAPASEPPVKQPLRQAVKHFNPVLQSQLNALDAEIAQRKEEQQRATKLVAAYRAKLDAIPVREQEIAELERDYEMNRVHYAKLLEQQLSAQTATQLEIRQKGEKFEILDLALPAERPTRPNRGLINMVGCAGGLGLGLLLAFASEFLGMAIIEPQDILAASGLTVLGVIPVIRTRADRRLRRLVAATSAVGAALACGAILFYHYHGQI